MANLDWLVVRDLRRSNRPCFWRDGPEIESGELDAESIATEVFFRRRRPHQQTVVHEHPADAAAASEGGPAPRRLPIRSVVHVSPRPAIRDKRPGRMSREIERSWSRPGISDRGSASGARAPTRSLPRSTAGGRRTARRFRDTPTSSPTARPRAAAGSTAAAMPMASTSRAARSQAPSKAGGARWGRLADETAGSSTTAPRPTPREALVRAQAGRLVGFRAGEVDRS